ncbi:CDP-glycerol glycerophosphotransferase family protein [Fictibacillus sp. S7]|uniref:CDP-glycerol glycerophosphotransferase family protein n=1 Tax=Fictibacillus sp. S7 TaxID=2212476 RepID=UPI0010128352|nr:CDP-glycerol glycerophosphotransferase family protein [Fictibacillus sp. S7]RXZ01667.1 CDP-glycerol glycerophosphotransferase family protein [Fictibacillus sp. S7]
MKALKVLWRPREQAECSLFSIEYQEKVMIVTIKKDENLQGEPMAFALMERVSKRILRFPVRGDRGKGLLIADVSVEHYLDDLITGVWDAYLELGKEGNAKKFRVRDKITDVMEIPPFYVKTTNKSFLPYSTIKGNLSFKCDASKATMKINIFTLEDNGVLTFSGNFNVPSWKIRDAKQVKKELILKSKNQEISVRLTKGKAVSQDDPTHFEARLDWKDKEFSQLEGQSIECSVKFTYEQKEMVLPVSIPPLNEMNQSAVFETSKGIKKLLISREEKDGTMAILLTTETVQAEIDAIYSETGEIVMLGRVVSSDEEPSNISQDALIVLKNRDTEEEYTFETKIVQSAFKYTFNIEDLIHKGLFTHGIWDLYLLINDQNIRLVTRLDGITNKQKFLSIPQQLVKDKEGKLFAVKPYYTLHEEVSIFCRDYINVKSIERVSIEKNRLKIRGKLNIQPPNKDFPSSIEGRIKINGGYGRKYEIPVIWDTKKTGKSKLEFQFELSGDTNSIEPDEMLKDINFDLIDCEITLGDGIIPFMMNIDPAKVIVTLEDRIRHSAKYKNVLAKWGQRLYKVCHRVLPVHTNTFIFQSFHGKSYSCSPKAIYEEMVEQKRDFKAVWVLNQLKQEVPGNAVIVRPHSLKYYYYMATAKFFINNGNFPDFYEKRTNTVHLQTWHGTPLKKLGYDIDPNSPSYAENTSPQISRRNARWDYLIGPNQYTSDILKRAFKFEKEMLDVGYPRNDIFYKPGISEKAENIKKKLTIPKNKKVILYAPTWRDYDFHNGNQHKPYEFKFDLQRFQEKFGEEYVLLLRLHYRDATRIKIKGYENFIYNVSSYDDIQELYLISDLLITDYSSVMFDYANLGRPIIFFTYDLKRYGSQVRGFYMDFEAEAPGPIVLNEEQLFHNIKHIDKVKKLYKQRYKQFQEKFCHLEDGQASSRTLEALLK